MIQLQSEDSDAAAELVQQARSPLRGTMALSSSSESPEIIGVGTSASYDDDMPTRSIQDDIGFISSSVSKDGVSPVSSPRRKHEQIDNRRRSVKEIISQIHGQDPAGRAEGLAELQKLGAVPLHGLSFDGTSPPPPPASNAGDINSGATLRVQSGQFMSEVVGRLSEKPATDDDSTGADTDSKGEESTLDDDAKMYQERLTNRNNNVLVKRDAASFRVKKDVL